MNVVLARKEEHYQLQGLDFEGQLLLLKMTKLARFWVRLTLSESGKLGGNAAEKGGTSTLGLCSQF
jgi:hypothetical protein